MSPADFWYVLVKKFFFQNMKGKKHGITWALQNQDQNWPKSKQFASLIDSISAIMNFENIKLWHFLKPFEDVHMCAKF